MDTPYRRNAEAVVAAALELIEQIFQGRPEVTELRGRFVLSFDLETRTIVLSVPLREGRVVFLERILVDPAVPERFGASELPMAIAIEASKVTH